jgi:hypothetical protein
MGIVVALANLSPFARSSELENEIDPQVCHSV